QNGAIEKCPPDKTRYKAQLYKDLGDFYLAGKQNEAAAHVLEQAIELDPENADALNNLAFLLAEDLNAPERALPYAERLPRLRPKDPAILDTVGWVYFKAGNDDKAREYLLKSLDLDDKSPTTHMHLAYVLFKGVNR